MSEALFLFISPRQLIILLRLHYRNRIGLFHRGILQSGNVLMPFALNRDVGSIARRVGEGLNCSMKSTSTLKLCLERAKVDDILDWQCRQPWCIFRDFAMPVIEHNPSDLSPPFIVEHPVPKLRRGDFNKVPIIVGFSENEGLSYVLSCMDYIILHCAKNVVF